MKAPPNVPMRQTRAMLPSKPSMIQGLTLPPSMVEMRDVFATEGGTEEETPDREPRVEGGRGSLFSLASWEAASMIAWKGAISDV